jgi:hypothetical protein
LTVLVLLALLLACTSVTETRGSDLKEVVKTFHHDIRWRYNNNAAASVDARHSAAFLDQLDSMKEDLNISDYQIRRVELSADGTRAKVRVRLKYFKMPSTVLKDEMIDQVWQQKNKRWYLLSQEGGPFDFPPEEEKEPASPQETTGPDASPDGTAN